MNNRKTSQGFANISLKILKYVVMIIVAVIFATSAFDFGSKVFYSQGMEPSPGTDMTFTVEKDTTIKELGEMLEEYGVIEDAGVFRVQSMVHNVKSIEPGTYSFNTSQNGEEIFKVITAGPEENKKKESEE